MSEELLPRVDRRARAGAAEWPMRQARTIEDFVANPVGRFSVGATHVVWCRSATLCGTVHWGRPTEANAGELVRRLEITGHAALAGGFDSLVDTRAVESFEGPAFAVLFEFAKHRLPEWSRRVRRQAVIVPAGLVGAVVAGLLPLIGWTHPLRFFASPAEALAWLDRPDLAAALDDVRRIADHARDTPPLLRGLREHLDRSLVDASIASAARALRVSPRSLQRDLGAHGTHFTEELMRARLRAARALLELTDEKVEAVARQVGCGTSSRLSRLFRRYVGQTPARYRARRCTTVHPRE